MTIAQSILPESWDIAQLAGYHLCDREQIHLLGHIQPHGVLIGINESELKIVQISENTTQFFNLSASSFIDQPLSVLFPQSQIDVLRAFFDHRDLEVFNPIKITIQIQEEDYSFQGIIHRSNGLLILELEPLPKDSDPNFGFYSLAKSTAASIRKAEGFEEMSNLLAQQVRKITQLDRVMIYRFDLDNSGIVIAEAKDEHVESFLGLHFPSADIPDLARKLYYKSWIRQIVDVNSYPVPIVPLNNPITQETIDLSFSTLRSVSPIHIKYLQKMGVSASFSISLINDGKLWGMIVGHHFSPRYIDYEIRKTCEFLGQLMSIEIVNKFEHQSKKAQEKIEITQSRLKQNILHLNQSTDHIFSQDVENILDLINAQGAVVCLGDRISKIGICPSQEFLRSLISWLENKSEDVFHTNCLSQLYPEALSIKNVASGILAISISLNHTSYHIIWFRGEVIQTVNWAGDPSKLALDDGLSPQRSFELWKEIVNAKSLPWDKVEIEAAIELRGTLMLAALEFSQQSLKLEAERAQVASMAKSNFLAKMSHELRTPLNAILGCTQLMRYEDSQSSQNHKFNEYVDIISHSSEHLLSLIEDVLEMSKIESGKTFLEESIFDLGLSLKRMQEIMEVRAKAKSLQLILVMHPSLPQYIKSDERKIRQVLMNLIGNAIKFTDNGYIMVRISSGVTELESPKFAIHFEVEDTGKGIAPEETDKLFEAFVQTASGRESQTGTGLGLSISQQFVRFMGGEIAVASNLGKGSIFQFDIIAEEVPNDAIKMDQKVVAKPAPKKSSGVTKTQIQPDVSTNREISTLRILLVEDNQFNQMIALRFLAKLGYQADCAVNGFEVLKALEIKSYDLILMDVQMPEMDGLEATRRIRLLEKESDCSSRLVIVAMTANAMAEDRENCFAIGMDDFISKPIRIEHLAEILEKYKK
jgi:light-regulated signal transduction histidine kinase (bacteriophytochrome)/CheY-like chemotaxis protein